MSKNKKGRRKSRHRKPVTKPTTSDVDNKNNIEHDSFLTTTHTSSTSKSTGNVTKNNHGSSSQCSTEEDVNVTKTVAAESSSKKRKALVEDETTTTFIACDSLSSNNSSSASKKKSKKRRKVFNNIRSSGTDCDNNHSSMTNKRPPTSKAENIQQPIVPPSFPFPVDQDDHCESPIEAYRDIVPYLTFLSTVMCKNTLINNKLPDNDNFRIYDPYYCDGAVVRNFASLGFKNVYNRNEDCYITWETNFIFNEMDVLVTNPPYSENHIERLMQFVTSDTFINMKKPWFLLLPQWVHKKDYYVDAISKIGNTRSNDNNINHDNKRQQQPFYLIPKKRYVYLPPPNYRSSTKSDVHKKSSPFISMWYCWGGTTQMNEQCIQLYYNSIQNNSNVDYDLARSRSAIRDLRRSTISSKKAS